MSSRSHGNLPAEVNTFVGRRRELAETRRLLSAARLVTLIGPGGVGKTRLARQVAASIRGMSNGVWFVELAGLWDGELVAPTVSGALGLTDPRDEPIARLADYLHDKELLLVLDHCEHVVEACAVMLAKLLASAPRVKVLAASQHVLGVEGEHILTVPPLPVLASAGPPLESDAVALFADRVAEVLPGFVVNRENQQVVSAICRRLEGIPLAIELAASRSRAFGLDRVLAELDESYGFLDRGRRGAPGRHQTLAGAITWSFDLCSPAEQLLWARLSVFVGSFGLDAVREVCSGDGIAGEDVFDLLSGLLDKSIIGREEGSYGRDVRFRMLRVIRQFGVDRLAESRAEPFIGGRHLDYYRGLVERAADDFFGPGEIEWLTRLRTEHDNLRAALEFSVAEPESVPVALDLSARLEFYWMASGLIREGYRWLRRALAAGAEPSRERARALMVAGSLGTYQGHFDDAAAVLAESRSLAERFADDRTLADLDRCAAQLAFVAHDRQRVAGLLDRCVAQYRALGDGAGLFRALYLGASFADITGDDQGSKLAQEALALAESAGAGWSRGYGLFVVGLFGIRAGDVAGATTRFQQALVTLRDTPDQKGIAQCLVPLGYCAAIEGKHARAARLLGAADEVLERSGASLIQRMAAEGSDSYVRMSRREMGDAEFAEDFAAGRAMAIDDAVDFALGERRDATHRPKPRPTTDLLDPLTRREAEVAQLVSEGMTNREIASKLVISQRTAEAHVDHILAKLGFRARTQIAAWVVARTEGVAASEAGTSAEPQ